MKAVSAMPPPTDAHEAKGPALAAAYFATFGALGIYGPFLALYLQHRGLDAPHVAGLLALLPVVRIVAGPAWGLLADVWRSAGRVLRLVALGSAASFALLAVAPSHVAVALVLVVFAAFRAPSSTLVDVLALRWAAREGRHFGAIRAWGTAGYTFAVLGTGFLVTHRGTATIVPATVALLCLTALSVFALPAGGIPDRSPLAPAIAALVRRPRFLAFLVTAALHQVGLAAYDSLFPAYLSGLADATYAGIAVTVGACSEVLFMAASARILPRLGLARVLALAYAASALRWAVIATVTHPLLLVFVQLLHAVSFGGFYLAAVALVNEESPPAVRASAQGIFMASTWGVANAGALALAGVVAAYGGMRAVFLVATFASLAGAVMASRLGDARPLDVYSNERGSQV